jgi:ABC-2 type transport system permease protein
MMMALLRKELREHLFSRKGLFNFFFISILYSIVAFSFISVKELSLLAQVEVNMTFIKVMLGVSSFVLIILGSTMVSGEKEKGTLESLLLTPLSKLRILVAKFLGIITFWIVLILRSLPYIAALSVGTNLFPKVFLFVLIIGSFMVLGFAGLSLAISAWVTSTKNAMMYAIIIFFIAIIPMFLSTTTKKAGFAYVVNQWSPVSSSMLAMKDTLVNKLGALAIVSDSLPILLFFIIMGVILVFASKKMNFLGGE